MASLEPLHEKESNGKSDNTDERGGDRTAKVERFGDRPENNERVSEGHIGHERPERFKRHRSVVAKEPFAHFVVEEEEKWQREGIAQNLSGRNHRDLVDPEDKGEQETGGELETGDGEHGDESSHANAGGDPGWGTIDTRYGNEFFSEPPP